MVLQRDVLASMPWSQPMGEVVHCRCEAFAGTNGLCRRPGTRQVNLVLCQAQFPRLEARLTAHRKAGLNRPE